jgi:hypothetical protein
MTIQESNKTIIIQGKVFPTTEQLVRDLRKLSDAKIIVSTWIDEEIDIEDVENCITLFLQDPGAGPIQNFSRQLYGANQALGLIDDGLVAKIRSDAICNKDVFSVYNNIASDSPRLQHKIFISNVMSCVPEFRVFSPSDWIYVGRDEDVKEWFNIEQESRIASNYVDCCEQVFCVANLLKNEPNLSLEGITELSAENIEMTRQLFEQNFIFVGTQSGFGTIISRYLTHLDNDERFMPFGST